MASRSGAAQDSAEAPSAALPFSNNSAGAVGVGSLAARLESLKRESVRPSLASGQAMAGVVFEAAAPIDAQALTRLAIQLFDDEQFRQLCDKGMNAQLTRSKDGATGEADHAPPSCCRQLLRLRAACGAWRHTPCFCWPLRCEAQQPPSLQIPTRCPSSGALVPAAETKIQELAGIVRQLRRGMKELQAKANEFVAAACKFEKEVGQQVGGCCRAAQAGKLEGEPVSWCTMDAAWQL